MFVPSSAHVCTDPGALSQPTLSIRPASSSPRLLPTLRPCSPPGSCRLPPGGRGDVVGGGPPCFPSVDQPGNQWASGWDRGHLYPAPLADILSLGQEHKRGWGVGVHVPCTGSFGGPYQQTVDMCQGKIEKVLGPELGTAMASKQPEEIPNSNRPEIKT